MEFAKHFRNGALLTVVWSSGRLQHIPMFFLPLIYEKESSMGSSQGFLSASPATARDFNPQIFSSPAAAM